MTRGGGATAGMGSAGASAEIARVHRGQTSTSFSGDSASNIKWHSGQVRFDSITMVLGESLPSSLVRLSNLIYGITSFQASG